MSKLIQLAKYLKIPIEEIEEDGNTFYTENEKYLILNEEEVYEIANDNFDNYINNELLYELPEWLKIYFDKDLYKEDNFDDPFEWLNEDEIEFQLSSEERCINYYVFKI